MMSLCRDVSEAFYVWKIVGFGIGGCVVPCLDERQLVKQHFFKIACLNRSDWLVLSWSKA